jgi:catechol 2,3-dioxygenase-like lactoylglutathione lyase family enzyme
LSPGNPGRFTWTIIGVADVRQSFRWYQSLLGLSETAPTHDYFGQIVDSDGTVLLRLHKWGAYEHPSLASPHYATPGNGLLLFVRVDNFDIALPRARALVGLAVDLIIDRIGGAVNGAHQGQSLPFNLLQRRTTGPCPPR